MVIRVAGFKNSLIIGILLRNYNDILILNLVKHEENVLKNSAMMHLLETVAFLDTNVLMEYEKNYYLAKGLIWNNHLMKRDKRILYSWKYLLLLS